MDGWWVNVSGYEGSEAEGFQKEVIVWLAGKKPQSTRYAHWIEAS